LRDVVDPISAKSALRREFRRRRRQVVDEGRSERICDVLGTVVGAAIPARSGTVMVFDAVAGEPDPDRFVAWCHGVGLATIAPTPSPTAVEPVDPASVDVVVVPGLAFTPDGRRLGQGGGWYDRFLARVRPDCLTIGVAFDAQIVDDLPTESHDVVLDLVVTESGVIETQPRPRPS
jgi:5-formyltetrahydrofolate cyclo-ligase